MKMAEYEKRAVVEPERLQSMESSITMMQWDTVTYTWEIKDFLDLREMAKDESSLKCSRIESMQFHDFTLWLFPYGQRQHNSWGSIDLSLMYRGTNDYIMAKWSACFLDSEDGCLARTRLSDPLKKYHRGGDGRRFSYSQSETSLIKWLICGALRIRCQVHIAIELKSTKFIEPGNVFSSSILKSDIITYCKNSEAKDVTILCGDEKYCASRFMLAARSKVLSAMLTGKFIESSMSHIALNDFSPEILKEMLDFIHYDTCNLLEKATNITFEHIQQILKLYAAADKYDIQGLSQYCDHVLIQHLDDFNIVDIMLFAEQRGSGRLIEAGKMYLQKTSGWNLWQKLRQNCFNGSIQNANTNEYVT